MQLQFTKMQGLGNDFMVVDAINQSMSWTARVVQRLADRHRGIGFDQLLVVEKPTSPAADFRYRIFNADGSEVGQCGNGARCFARFVYEQGLTTKTAIQVETASGIMTLTLVGDADVCVQMGLPIFEAARIPFVSDHDDVEQLLDLRDQSVAVSVVSMGNPHAVLLVDDIQTAPVAQWGPLIQYHPRFPERVNVGFMQIMSPTLVHLRVYERGAGETQACGTGACAAVVVGIRRGLLDASVDVVMSGGRLHIQWLGVGHAVEMTGPAVTVFHGHVHWESFAHGD